MNRSATLLFLVLVSFSASAQIYDTEVWVGKLDRTAGRFVISDLKNISNHPGYDNQPAFFADGDRLIYTSEAGQLADDGNGLQAVVVDLRSGQSTAMPSMNGFSPTPMSDGTHVMMLRDGRVWRYDLAGGKPEPLTETKDAGYFNRIDDRTFVLFMNDKEQRVVIYDQKSKAMKTVATGAVTPIYSVPGQSAVTFVAESPFPVPEKPDPAVKRTLSLRRLDLESGSVTTLAAIPFRTGGHHVWTATGTLLMASGRSIYEWSPARPDQWTPVFEATDPGLQGITRIALSVRGDRIAIVSTPAAEAVIRDSRASSNRGLVARKPADVTQIYGPDAVVTTASGKQLAGREAVKAFLTEAYGKHSDLLYVRTTDGISVGPSGAIASERGHWTGHWSGPEGTAELRGDYLTGWQSRIGDLGAPEWTIASESFVMVECKGAGCPK